MDAFLGSGVMHHTVWTLEAVHHLTRGLEHAVMLLEQSQSNCSCCTAPPVLD